MNGLELLRSAVRGVLANRLRSILTTLGVFIGVSSVVAMLAVANGVRLQVEKEVLSGAANVLSINQGAEPPGGPMGPGGRSEGPPPSGQPEPTVRDLTLEDARALTDRDKAPHVTRVAPIVQSYIGEMVYEGTVANLNNVYGTVADYFLITNRKFSQGNPFSADDVRSGRKAVVISHGLAKKLFLDGRAVNRRVLMGGVPFVVVGVLSEEEDSDWRTRESAFAPITTLQGSLAGFGALSSIEAQIPHVDDAPQARAEVTAILRDRHQIEPGKPADFQIEDPLKEIKKLERITLLMTLLLSAIGGISLLVGGIGITNIMLVTVTERIREIGIRKALGATDAAIRFQFLIEATLLCLFGGGCAVALVLGATSIQWHPEFSPVVLPSSVAIAFGVCVLLGLFFGGYPAHRAARMRPAEALRHD